MPILVATLGKNYKQVMFYTVVRLLDTSLWSLSSSTSSDIWKGPVITVLRLDSLGVWLV